MLYSFLFILNIISELFTLHDLRFTTFPLFTDFKDLMRPVNILSISPMIVEIPLISPSFMYFRFFDISK